MGILVDDAHQGVSQLPFLEMAQGKEVAAVFGILGEYSGKSAVNCRAVQFHTAVAGLPFEMQQPHDGAFSRAALADDPQRLVGEEIKRDIAAGHHRAAVGAEIGVLPVLRGLKASAASPAKLFRQTPYPYQRLHVELLLSQ